MAVADTDVYRWAPVVPGPLRTRPWWLGSFAAPALAAALAFLAAGLRWRGMDLPAQIYRVGLFHRAGLTVWDSQWYGGHWTLNYSVIFPPVAGLLGIQVMEAVSAAAAAWAFDRLAVGHFGRRARLGSILFAAGTLAQVVIGQVPFLMGEALALGACWAAARRRWPLAIPLAAAASLASPLAGAFLMLAVVSWMVAISDRSTRLRLGLLVLASAAPIVILTVLFPGSGMMPFPGLTFLKFVALFGSVAVVIPWRERALKAGVLVYLAAGAVSFVLATPMGGNIGRLGECIGAPLAACVLWPHRRRLLVAALVPLAMWQWAPAYASFTRDRSDPSAQAAYFTPLLAFLGAHADHAGRVEIVPTRLHWEAAYVAAHVPLARGWERQLDTGDNPLFYTKGALTDATYHRWLVDNGVRYVAMPDAPLDYAAIDEGRLVAAGAAELRPIWSDAHWRVFEVAGSPGIIDGPGRLVSMDGGQIVVDAAKRATIVVRVRYSSRWTLTRGSGCVREAPGGWTAVQAARSGQFHLGVRLVADPKNAC